MYSCIFGVSHRLSRFVFLAVICTKLRWLVPVSLFSPPPRSAKPCDVNNVEKEAMRIREAV